MKASIVSVLAAAALQSAETANAKRTTITKRGVRGLDEDSFPWEDGSSMSMKAGSTMSMVAEYPVFAGGDSPSSPGGSKSQKASKGNPSPASKSSKASSQLPGPYTPVYCPIESANNNGERIPISKLVEAGEMFRTNGGAVLYNNNFRQNVDDVYDATVAATDYYVEAITALLEDGKTPTIEPFDTPEYEMNANAGNYNPGPGPSGFQGCDECTGPEPYPFRTSLPKIAMPRCPNAPYAIFIPATNEDAASAIRIIKEHDETFSILSGGHDYECQSGVANGVIIITSLLNTLEIDYDTGIATVGAGVLWQTVYDEINEEELNGGLNAVKRWGAMGAQCGLVSVSGFTLGGGMCWHMSPIHGTGADNAIAITAITADGDVIEATIDNDHSDLRYGMAGTGGMSMAMAAGFKIQLQESRPGNYLFRRYEWRFSDDDEYAINEIPEIMIAIAGALDQLADDENYKHKIGASRVRLQYQAGYGSAGGHRLRTWLMASEDTDIGLFGEFMQLVEDHPPRTRSLEYFTSINDYVKKRRNTYPSSNDAPRVSSFIKGGENAIQEALIIHLRYYLETGDDTQDGPNRLIAGNDVDFYLMDNFIKFPDRVSLAPAISEARWHITNRANHPGNQPELEKKINCKNREITHVLKEKLGSQWAGPYTNYLDGAAEKADYYDPNGGDDHFQKVKAIKVKYDEDNFFRKIKGINVNDDDIECLDEFCDTLTPYYAGWEFPN